jgi:PPOX class probable F420-dependent enzyme
MLEAMAMETDATVLEGAKYLNLETYRRSGKGVRTPVWFAGASGDDALYVYSTADAGKVKRIRGNHPVRIARCDVRGNVTGAWLDALAEIGDGAAFDRGMRLLDRKYWPWKRLLDLVAYLAPRHQRVMLLIRLKL